MDPAVAQQQQLTGIQQALDRMVTLQQDVGNRNTADNRIESTVRELVKQTTRCEGVPMAAVRRWMRDIEIAMTQVGQGFIVRIITGTISGSLRDEIEQYVTQRIQQYGLNRNQLPWADIRAHVEPFFLHADERSALRDELDELRQSAHESDNMFGRRFRDLADTAYPVNQRNDDQHRIMLKAYVRGLRLTTTARKLIQDGAPCTLQGALHLVSQYAERQDAFDRMRPGEEPMEVGTVAKGSSALGEVSDVLKAVAKQQEQLMSRIAKMEAEQKVWRTKRPQRKAGPPSVPKGGGRGPTCYECHQRGHIARNCTMRRAASTPQQGN